jgi:L-arginine dehydrogenase
MPHSVRVLDRDAIQPLLARIDALAVMRELFQSLAAGQATQPPQTLTLFPGGSGDFITYLGVLESASLFGGKLSPYISRPSGAVITAWTLLMSMETGQPRLLCDAGLLTTERTAATTALAVSLLARADASTLAIIGSGPVAQAHLRMVRALRPWGEIRLYSSSLLSRHDRQEALRGIDARVSAAESVVDATRDADVVMLCTSSATPVLEPATLHKPALITSISTNAAQAHEVPPASLSAMDVYCDDRHGTPLSAGEMVLAVRDHGWKASGIAGDLSQLVSGSAQLPHNDRHTFFRSIGLGLEDVAMAAAVLALLEQDDAGH